MPFIVGVLLASEPSDFIGCKRWDRARENHVIVEAYQA